MAINTTAVQNSNYVISTHKIANSTILVYICFKFFNSHQHNEKNTTKITHIEKYTLVLVSSKVSSFERKQMSVVIYRWICRYTVDLKEFRGLEVRR